VAGAGRARLPPRPADTWWAAAEAMLPPGGRRDYAGNRGSSTAFARAGRREATAGESSAPARPPRRRPGRGS
jgi:hypothetical protein